MGDFRKIVLVGIGGYGNTYVNAVLNNTDRGDWKVVGVVDPFAAKANGYASLQALGIPFFNTLEDFYAVESADLAVIATPIPLHCPQSCCALEHGTNVLCEKPVSAIPEEAVKMLECSRKTGRFLAIGYQWSFSKAVLALKADILAGRLGTPLRLKALVLWPRTDAYYARNNWAGSEKNARCEWILDSPVNNACAHYLFNMLYILGPEIDAAAAPTELTAELYRANPITNFDTASLSIKTDCGASILFLTSHAISRLRGPEFIYEFSGATVSYTKEHHIQATFADGTTRDYGDPNINSSRKFFDAIAALDGKHPVPCTVKAAMMQTKCVWAAHLSVPNVPAFPERDIYKVGVPGHQVRVMTGLAEALERAYDNNTMLSVHSNATWSNTGQTISL